MNAAEITLEGNSSVPVTGDLHSVKTLATKAAKRQAVIAGLNRIIGPEASTDPKVIAKIQSIVERIKI